ncbi:MAG: hypothetical protein WD512_16240 [Candidatus Paceibacterota bacterium]
MTLEVTDMEKDILSSKANDENTTYQDRIVEYAKLVKIATKIEARYIINIIIVFEQPFDTLELIKFWDYFRMNNPKCLAKFPSIAHIKERHMNGLTVDPKLYESACVFFEQFITSPHNHTTLNIINSNPSQDNLFISCKYDDIENPFLIFNVKNTVGDELSREDKIDAGLDPNSTLLSVSIINLDGPFDQDPDREPEEYDIIE